MPHGFELARDVLLVRERTRRFEVVTAADVPITLLMLGIDVDAELEAAIEGVRTSERAPVVVVAGGFASVTSVPLSARGAA